MKFSTAIFLAATYLVSASPLPRDIPKGVISIPVEKVTNNTIAGQNLVSRKTIPESLTNQIVQYVADIDLGTPGQSLQALIDTGSSDLWVYSSDVKQGGYDSGSSSSYNLLEEGGFHIEYAKGEASGDWVTDNIKFGTATLNDFQFATVVEGADLGDQNIGVFGIARLSVESQANSYHNFPQVLKDNGLISTNAYSLFLDDLSSTSATLLFGGLDTSKYTGDLKTVPFTSSRDFSVDFTVSAYDGKLNGVLDSGTSYTYLPREAFQAVVDGNGWSLTRDSHGTYYSSEPPSGNGITFNFSGIEIHVSSEELFIHVGEDQWLVGLATTDDSQGITLLGDSTLRSAYVVYDLDNGVAGIAPAKYDGGAPNIVAIQGSIPNSTPA